MDGWTRKRNKNEIDDIINKKVDRRFTKINRLIAHKMGDTHSFVFKDIGIVE